MSPRKAALAKAPKVAAKPAPAKPAPTKAAARTPVRAVAKPAEKSAAAANGSASADATRLAAEIERGLKAGKLDTLTPQADLSITKTDGVTSKVPGTGALDRAVLPRVALRCVRGSSRGAGGAARASRRYAPIRREAGLFLYGRRRDRAGEGQGPGG